MRSAKWNTREAWSRTGRLLPCACYNIRISWIKEPPMKNVPVGPKNKICRKRKSRLWEIHQNIKSIIALTGIAAKWCEYNEFVCESIRSWLMCLWESFWARISSCYLNAISVRTLITFFLFIFLQAQSNAAFRCCFYWNKLKTWICGVDR